MTFSRAERFGLILLLGIFTWFTWRGLTMFFSGDDMMNMYGAWDMNPWRLARAQVMLWMPAYRPLGAVVYRIFYTIAGFHPEPLYAFCWLLLAFNVVVAYRLFRVLTGNVAEALTAVSLILVHGSYSDLYYSAGTIYDRLCFLFTALGLLAYCRFRRNPSRGLFALICISTILAMDSKESGIALPPLMLCLEVLFFRPSGWSVQKSRVWIRQLSLLFTALGAISLMFIVGRVHRTPELANPLYQPQFSIALWLTHLSEYFRLLSYDSLPASPAVAGILLSLMFLAVLLSRHRVMAFGLIFFLISVTPVALLNARFGYVLYLPSMGLGLFFTEVVFSLVRLFIRPMPRFQAIAGASAFLLITIATTWFHVRHWPPAPVFNRQISPEWRLTRQFQQDYPVMPPGSKLLFVKDEFPEAAWDLMFNIRLLYHDKSIVVKRLQGLPAQRPDAVKPLAFDHIFETAAGRYVELDPRNPEESIRLNILRDYAVGREMDTTRRDHYAYVVSGLRDSEEENAPRWTEPHAVFKFSLWPAPAVFRARFFLPDVVSAQPGRILSVRIGGDELKRVPLCKAGLNEISFPVPPGRISPDGFTFVEMNVEHPFIDENGVRYGVVLISAGFDYHENSSST